jgi:hypothetical protein
MENDQRSMHMNFWGMKSSKCFQDMIKVLIKEKKRKERTRKEHRKNKEQNQK